MVPRAGTGAAAVDGAKPRKNSVCRAQENTREGQDTDMGSPDGPGQRSVGGVGGFESSIRLTVQTCGEQFVCMSRIREDNMQAFDGSGEVPLI